MIANIFSELSFLLPLLGAMAICFVCLILIQFKWIPALPIEILLNLTIIGGLGWTLHLIFQGEWKLIIGIFLVDVFFRKGWTRINRSEAPGEVAE